jgi:ubiquinone/menaquinone biosynthesis C-methylase UbiE
MSNTNFWDDRYSKTDYIYGKKPNVFFKQELDKIKPGKLLLPFEGEGRNAVAAVIAGWDVKAFDQSSEGKKKALLLAEEQNIKIDYLSGRLEELDIPDNYFDTIGLIFAHTPIADREKFHRSIVQKLKPGGYIILEGFHQKQLGKKSGGPPQIEMLFTKEMLRSDFKEMNIDQLDDMQVLLDEGSYHKGEAHVIRMIAQKLI